LAAERRRRNCLLLTLAGSLYLPERRYTMLGLGSKSKESVGVDTNVFVHAANKKSEHYGACKRFLETAGSGSSSQSLCVSVQILSEVIAVLTKYVENPLTVDKAIEYVKGIIRLPGIRVLSTSASVMSELFALLEKAPRTGSRVFDVQFVALLKRHGIRKLYSYDNDMRQLAGPAGMEVVTP
jgi:predicted nucleic acid-binding protein